MKIIKQNIQPTAEQLAKYQANRGRITTRQTNLRFGKFVILSDFDLDGGHISSLLLSFFAKYWPELFTLGAIYRMNTPLYIVKTAKEELEFFSDDEYLKWAKTAPKHSASRYKGLGGFETEQFEKFLANRDKYLLKLNPLSEQDSEQLGLAFDKERADDRKDWLNAISYFDNVDA